MDQERESSASPQPLHSGVPPDSSTAAPNAIERGRDLEPAKTTEFREAEDAIRQASITPNDWKQRSDLNDALERLRVLSNSDPEGALRIWDRFVPGDKDKPDFLDSRDGGRIPTPQSSDGHQADSEGESRSAAETQLQKRFNRDANGRYFPANSPTRVAFEDRGDVLVTERDDPLVVNAMVLLARTKNWETLTVKGSQVFRRQVWLEGSLQGLSIEGYIPTRDDHQLLVDRIARPRAAQDSRDNPKRSVQDVVGREKSYLEILKAAALAKGATEAGAEKVVAAGLDVLREERPTLGRVVEHGRAPYDFNPDKSANYYVKLETDAGPKTIWGVGLERAFKKANVQVGEEISLKRTAKEPVTVLENERDKQGRLISHPKDSIRVSWEAISLTQLNSPSLRASRPEDRDRSPEPVRSR